VQRKKIVILWDKVAKPVIGGPAAATLGPAPERALAQRVQELRQFLNWDGQTWQPLVSELRQLGFDYDRMLADTPLPPGPHGPALQVANTAGQRILPCIKARLRQIELQTRCQDARSLAHALRVC
jgi:hypothetical protein